MSFTRIIAYVNKFNGCLCTGILNSQNEILIEDTIVIDNIDPDTKLSMVGPFISGDLLLSYTIGSDCYVTRLNYRGERIAPVLKVATDVDTSKAIDFTVYTHQLSYTDLTGINKMITVNNKVEFAYDEHMSIEGITEHELKFKNMKPIKEI